MPSKNLHPDFGFTRDWTPTEKPSSLTEVMGAQFKLGLMNSEILSLGRMAQSALVSETNDITSAADLNEALRPTIPFTKPMSAIEAGAIVAHQQEKQALQRIIQRGDNSISTSFFGFVTGLGGTALDPIGILSGRALTGVGRSILNRTLGKAFLGGRASRGILESSLEGALGNVATEMAFVIPSQIQEKEDVNITQQLVMAAAGGAAFPAVAGGIAVSYRVFKTLTIDKLSDAVNLTEARWLADKNPNMTEREIELVTRERGESLKTDYVRLQEESVRIQDNLKTATGPEEVDVFAKQIDENQTRLVDKAGEIDSYAQEFNNAQSIREDSNSKRNNLYNNPVANERMEAIADEPDVSFKERAEEEFNDLSDLEEPVRIEVEKVGKKFNEIDKQMQDVTKKADICAREGG